MRCNWKYVYADVRMASERYLMGKAVSCKSMLQKRCIEAKKSLIFSKSFCV